MWIIVTCIISVLIALYVAYVLKPEREYDANKTSIDAFIVKSECDANETPVISEDDPYVVSYDSAGRQVLILYGTEYGFSEEVAKLLFDRVLELNKDEHEFPWQPRILNVKHFGEVVDLTQEQICFIVISTSGDGVPPTDAREFVNEFLNRSIDLSHLRVSVLALGDSNYPHYCRTGRQVNYRFLELGANLVVDRHDVDTEDWTVVKAWSDQVVKFLGSVRDIEPRLDYLKQPSNESGQSFSRHSPFLAKLKAKRDLTVYSSQYDRETIHCEFDLTNSGLAWKSGDALGIYPQNNPQDVKKVLKFLDCDGNELIPFPKSAYHTDKTRAERQVTLEHALTCYYDLKHVKPELLQYLASRPSDRKTELQHILPGGMTKDNSQLWDYLSDRELKDVLRHFGQNGLPYTELLRYLRSLQPRYYSISSSPQLDPSTACVTAAIVRYHTHGRERGGVTTTYLQDHMSAGDQCPVFISQNPDFRLPQNMDIPVVLIGPGTGIAPFMAFIQEKELAKSTGTTYLYFGCRHKDKDFLYKDRLLTWSDTGLIQLRVAFSRDQENKIYVQDLLAEDAELIWKLLSQKSAHLYVCGDAKQMAPDVHTVLTEIVRGQGQMCQSEAENFLRQIEEENRYQKDVWVT